MQKIMKDSRTAQIIVKDDETQLLQMELEIALCFATYPWPFQGEEAAWDKSPDCSPDAKARVTEGIDSKSVEKTNRRSKRDKHRDESRFPTIWSSSPPLSVIEEAPSIWEYSSIFFLEEF